VALLAFAVATEAKATAFEPRAVGAKGGASPLGGSPLVVVVVGAEGGAEPIVATARAGWMVTAMIASAGCAAATGAAEYRKRGSAP
jgi:hypothetical protein